MNDHLLHAYLDGEVTAAERALVEQALASDFEFVSNVDDLDYDSPAPVKADEEGRYPAPVPGQWTEI